jgi:ribose/xylose/arabinose/galactoside ABC-type transport system permease subunit
MSVDRDEPGRPPLRAAGRWLLGSSTRVMLLVVALLVVAGTWLSPGHFLTAANVGVFASAAAVPLFVTIAAAVGLLGGVIDLSIGSMAGFGAAVFAELLLHGLSYVAATILALGAGLAVGLVNATACVVFGANSLLATIGMLTALQGLILVVLTNASVPAFIPGLYSFTGEQWHGIPVLLVCVLAAGGLAAVALGRTRYGRHVRAAGGGERASRRAGIAVGRLQFGLFLLTALFACVGGILYVGQVGAAQTTLGVGLELQIYAPVLLGGYSLTRGGVGSVVGALTAVFALELLGNVLNLRGVDPSWQDIAIGVIIIGAVYADGLRGGERFE